MDLGAGVGSGEGSYEYLVFTSTLLGVAARHGLVPICDWGDPDLDACFDEARALHHPIACEAGTIVLHAHPPCMLFVSWLGPLAAQS